jgi:hypothetical protein
MNTIYGHNTWYFHVKAGCSKHERLRKEIHAYEMATVLAYTPSILNQMNFHENWHESYRI